MIAPERPESPRLNALLGLLQDAAKPPTAAELDQGLGALRARVATRRPRTRRRVTLLAAALVACVALGVLLVPRLSKRSGVPEQPVAVRRVDGGKILEGGYLSEVGNAGVRLYFNDGSQFSLDTGTRGRLRAVSADGARMALDHGTASFRITHTPGRHWWVEAGPFVVSVTGTDFTVVWDPTGEEFTVTLRQGRVAVGGPIIGEELVLRPGQTLTVNLPKRVSMISEESADKASEGASQREPPASGSKPADVASAAVTASRSAQAPAGSGSAAPRHWREALASGQWDRILADVERDGVDTCLRTLSSDELFVLADAARYRRRPDLARAALLAQRERFPTSPRAPDAIFLLGRVEELRAGGKSQAIQRYDEYLARAPGGTYAAEALGRKMILVKDVAGPGTARQIAEAYLARFPNGSYAEAARTLQRVP